MDSGRYVLVGEMSNGRTVGDVWKMSDVVMERHVIRSYVLSKMVTAKENGGENTEIVEIGGSSDRD